MQHPPQNGIAPETVAATVSARGDCKRGDDDGLPNPSPNVSGRQGMNNPERHKVCGPGNDEQWSIKASREVEPIADQRRGEHAADRSREATESHDRTD